MDNAKNRVLLVQKILAHLRTNEHKTHWFPALSAEIRFRTIGAAVAFLTAVEALAGLVISSTITSSRTVPGFHFILDLWPNFVATLEPIDQPPIIFPLS